MAAKSSENCIYKHITAKIGECFKKYRENSGLSMREIYKQEKISIAVMSDMESGKKLPRVETLIRLMEKVNMPLEEVFYKRLIKNDPKNLKENSKELMENLMLDYGVPKIALDEALGYCNYLITKYSKHTDLTTLWK